MLFVSQLHFVRKSLGINVLEPKFVGCKSGIEKLEGLDYQINEHIVSENSFIGKSVVAHGGLAITKGKKCYTLSFVGSISKNGTKFKTFNKNGYKIKDAFPEEDTFKMF